MIIEERNNGIRTAERVAVVVDDHGRDDVLPLSHRR